MRYLLLFTFLGCLGACRTDSADAKRGASTARLSTELYVRYLETERQLKAHAAFSYGDSLPTLQTNDFPKGVLFQSKSMNPNQLPDRTLRYVYNGTGEYTPNGFVFTYEDPTGKNRTYTLKLAPIEDFSVKGTATPHGLTLVLKGAPFQANESLILLFLNEKNKAFSSEFKGPFDVEELAVPPAQLAGITPGKHFLYLVKKQITTSTDGNANITSEIEFYSKTIEVQIR